MTIIDYQINKKILIKVEHEVVISVFNYQRADDKQSLQKVSFGLDSGEVGHLKAEILLLEHRIDRLLQKEQAIQVTKTSILFHLICSVLTTNNVPFR